MTHELTVPFHPAIRGLSFADPSGELPVPTVHPPHSVNARTVAANVERDRAAEAERAAIQQVLAALNEAVQQIQKRDQQRLAEFQRATIDLAVAIASRLVHRKLTAGEFGLETLVGQLVAELGTATSITAYLHPEDLALLKQRLEGNAPSTLAPGIVDLAADTSLRRGDCRVQTDDVTAHSQWEAKLDEIRERLMRSLSHA
jgi:flagellar biosynthesis/type III secretory pathway protein FliH